MATLTYCNYVFELQSGSLFITIQYYPQSLNDRPVRNELKFYNLENFKNANAKRIQSIC